MGGVALELVCADVQWICKKHKPLAMVKVHVSTK